MHIAASFAAERDLEEQIVYADPMGNLVRLKDVARVVREYPTPSSYIESNGTKCVMLSIEARPGYNIVDMGRDAKKVIADYQKELPEDVHFFCVTDQSHVVNESVSTFLKELLIAIGAVILVVVLLMPMRVAMVSASTIPITIFISLGLFYLCGIELNTVTLADMDDLERARRVTFCGAADVGENIAGRNVVVLTSHYGFWEYYSFAALWLCRAHRLMVAYHPLKARAWDDFYMKLRKIDCVNPVSSKKFMRYFMHHRDGIDGNNLVIGLISDQNSPPRGECHWYRFLNHDSLFFDGGEHLALKFGLPVYYLELDRVKRGYYRCSYKMIYDGREQVEPHEITERYVRNLERTIVRRPELWLWSHNRWKFRREPVAETAAE